MIIDGLNLFIRNYIKSPVMSSNGQPMGGVVGFLGSLQKYVREIKPDEVVVVWDGPGGSRKRKTMFKGYKQGRSPLRLNRNVRMLGTNEETKNLIWQQLRLTEYLNNFPIPQFMEEDIEADDLIAFIARQSKYQDWIKIIVSLDKDFLQLCDDKTIIMRQDPVTWKTVVEEYGIHPNNFAIARSMAGDKSDNIKGIPGVGMKNIKKFLSFLQDQKSYYFQDLEDKCLEQIEAGNKAKFYRTVVENIEIAKDNYKIIQLVLPNISPLVAKKTRDTINNFVYELNVTDTQKMLLQDGIGHCNFNEMMVRFKKIVVENK